MTILLFFFNDTATTEIYTLSLHDALPIYIKKRIAKRANRCRIKRSLKQDGESGADSTTSAPVSSRARSEEHTSELQSPCNLVCRLLLEKKKLRQRLAS